LNSADERRTRVGFSSFRGTPVPLTRLAPPAQIEAVSATQSSVATPERIGPDATVRPSNRQPGGFTPWEIAIWIWITGAAGISCYL
jgi:hypothetical protein